MYVGFYHLSLKKYFLLFVIYFALVCTLYLQRSSTKQIKKMKESVINYSALWDKIGEWARKAGRFSARPAVLLYYVMVSKETPKSDKILIASALAYLVFPIDIISGKRLPIIGWLDEIVSLTVAYQKVQKHITPEIERKTEDVLEKWFPEYTRCEVIE